jgi:hypothetical protein
VSKDNVIPFKRPVSEFINEEPDIEGVKNTTWVWINRIPEGGLVDMIGEEDVGKGFFAVYLLSKLTRGQLSGRYYGRPIKVQIVAYEDDRGEWDKRLLAANADMTYVSYLKRTDGTVPDLSEHGVDIVRHWANSKIKFVYVDQLLDHLGVNTDNYNAKQVRNVLMPFHALLVKCGITVFATMHPNKKGSTPRSRLAGSAALWQPCRSAFYLAIHPDDEDARVLVNIKANRSARKPKSVEFQILDCGNEFRVGGRRIKTGVVHIMNEDSPLTQDDVLGETRRTTGRMEELDRRLEEALVDRPLYSELKADEYFAQFSFNALKRSLKRISGEVTPHSPGIGSRWFLAGARVPRSRGSARDAR